MSNITIEQMLSRRSVREFTDSHVSESDLELIIQAAQQAPSSINGQQVSLVVIRNKERIKKIAEIAGGQPQVAGADVFIAIVVDYYRTSYAMSLESEQHIIEQSAEGIVVGAVDAGIMLNALQTAANSLGYGSTAIGGIRRDPKAMVELLNLPQKTFPIVGMTLGVSKENNQAQVKPRVAIESFAMMENYDTKSIEKGVNDYEKTLRQWWDNQNLTQMPSYSKSVSGFYKSIYFPNVASILLKQGFDFEK
ncbi:nitroreductase family protein [Vibrio parahaemolyticus]|uniref:nitroreductase family protein n=1 Tax=Vibrio parahaemolyticus TaxID=670 RepID=UPI0023624566|nr:nitroreductase family protein [Vibrio parahaemolyticus]HCM1552984.1 nitroreductase family protein [Vibrio parahaemolyticus]HDU8574220.1 nitroreductase family protein [Vibrio parahaemolyticus]